MINAARLRISLVRAPGPDIAAAPLPQPLVFLN